MNIEDELKILINEEYGSLKNFANIIELPYSTVDSVFKRGFMNTGMSKLIPICRELDISLDALVVGLIKDNFEYDNSDILHIDSSWFKDEIPKNEIKSNVNATQNHFTELCKLNEQGKEKVYTYTKDLVDSTNYEIYKEPTPHYHFIKIPLYEEIKASAGLGSYLDERVKPTMTDFKSTEVPYGADHALYIKGNSMEPLIKDGQLVFVNKQPSINFGEIGIFIYNDEVYCKRLIKEGKKILLRSENTEYTDLIIDSTYPLVTVGKVLF
ncbi:MAG: S24 family peptidase [Lachnospirales bacterium]